MSAGMTQARTKEEFAVSLDLVPSVAATREQENHLSTDINVEQSQAIPAPSTFAVIANGAVSEKGEALINNRIIVPNRNPNSVILVSSKQTQRGIMSIVGQTVLKIDSGKRMILVPNVNRTAVATSNLQSHGVLVTDQSKPFLQTVNTANQQVKIIPEIDPELYSKGVLSVAPLLSSGSDLPVSTLEGGNSSTCHGRDGVSATGKPSGEHTVGYVTKEEAPPVTDSNSLKELLKKDVGAPTDNLNMLAHVSNQIFGVDQNIVYKRAATDVAQTTEDATAISSTGIISREFTPEQNGTGVLYTCIDPSLNKGNNLVSINYVPVLKAEPTMANSTVDAPTKGISTLDTETKPSILHMSDAFRKRKRRILTDAGNWRGRRVGHPFNPNSLPPPASSPACATCVLFEHTLLKMATRGFWGGNKGSLEDVFRSIRVEGTDITDTVEDVTRRCYDFVRKKLLDLREKRNDAYMYMRSYIDEFDSFLERVPPVAVVAMIIYLPMAADYELVTWHGVPPTGWSEYRRAVIMREVFEVLYHFGTQTNSVPEYERSFFEPRSRTKILKDRTFDMRQDEEGNSQTVKRGAYQVLYSEKDVNIEEATELVNSPGDGSNVTVSALTSTVSPLGQHSPDRNNNAIPATDIDHNSIEREKNVRSDTNEEVKGDMTDFSTSAKRKAAKEEDEALSPKLRRTTRKRRTRSSFRESFGDEASDLSSLGGEDNGEADASSVDGLRIAEETDVAVSKPESRVEAASTASSEKSSIITPQFVESIVAACGNSSSWNSPSNSVGTSDTSAPNDEAETRVSPHNERETILQNVQQSVVFESLWTKRAPDEPHIVMPDGAERRFGDYLSQFGVETSCPADRTIMIVNGVSYRAKEVLGYFRRGVQFVEHTREHGTTIDTLTTMKEDIKTGAVRKIPPGKISKLVHPSLHLENYTAFILPIGVSEGGGFTFKRKGFRHRFKRHRQRHSSEVLGSNETAAADDEEMSPKRLYHSEVSNNATDDGRSGDRHVFTTPDGEDKSNGFSPVNQYSPSPLSRGIKEEPILASRTLQSIQPRSKILEEGSRTPCGSVLLRPVCQNSKECQTETSIVSEGMQTEAVSGILGHDLNVRLATSITDGIFRGFKKLMEEDENRHPGNLSHLYSLHSLIDSYKKTGRFLLEMAENLETIMTSDTIRKT